MLTYNFLACGSASVDGDNATIEMCSNVKGIYKCSLDGGTFQQCMAAYYYEAHCVSISFL